MPEETNNNTNNKTKTKETYSPYDWESFDFKIYDEDRDSYILTESPLMQPILKYVDENGDGKMSVEEFSRHKGDKNIRDLLSKMICVHRSEWAYSGDAFTNLKKEVEKYYDEEIKRLNPNNENARAECESKRNEDLKLFEEKVKNLTFLDQIEFDNKSSLPDGYFYFFHPIAFVEQMKMMAIEDYSKFVQFAASLEIDRRNVVSQKSIQLLGYIAYLTNTKNVIITSTIRYPRIQALAMYGTNIRYASPGEKVKEVYRECMAKKLNKEATIEKMVQKIEELSRKNERVSKHCVSIDEYNKLNVIDVSYTGISDTKKYISLLAESECVIKILHSVSGIANTTKIRFDKGEPCIHVEIKQ